ncbi:hypothetical protein BC835DRAFT_1500853 [Cytidiella melzeri]|nr:hypothetical protein BC835DRAFT_1500853 [Cytidiella melzeri]
MSCSSSTPSHWPPDILYLKNQRYHSSVPEIVRLRLRKCALPSAISQPQSGRGQRRPPVVIMQIQQDDHPAKGQLGLFAAKKIPPRSYIIDYAGEVHCDDRPDSDYDLSLLRSQDGHNVGVDASKMGNESRFINDYRGVAERPNVQFRESLNETGELCMSIWSGNEAIKKGDELVVSYGKGFWKARRSE